MEKRAYTNPNYPQDPTQMGMGTSASAAAPTSAAGTSTIEEDVVHIQQSAPPSYDQATQPNYPKVQVLPQPHVEAGNRSQPMGWAPQQPIHPQNITSNTAYVNSGIPIQQPPIVGQQPVVIIQQSALFPLGPEPAYILCPSCHVQKLTRIEYEPSSRTHLMAALLCLVGLWCCVCLPYCAGSCMNTNHYCGNCNIFLGTYGNGI